MDKYCQYAMVAADEAIENSGLDLETIDKERLGVIVGSGIGGLGTIEKEHNKLMEKGPNRVSPLFNTYDNRQYGSWKHCNKVWC